MDLWCGVSTDVWSKSPLEKETTEEQKMKEPSQAKEAQ